MAVSEIMSRNLVLCYPQENLKTVLERLGEFNIGRIPVVEPGDPDHMVGLITR